MTDVTLHPTSVPNVPWQPPHERRWSWFHVKHHWFRHILLTTGHVSSIAFAILLIANIVFANTFYPFYNWIGFGYLVIQLAEVCAENHLRSKDVLVDHALSLTVAIVGLIEVVMMWDKVLPAGYWEVQKFWTAIAWLDILFGVIINNTILNAPYQREEQEET